MEKKLTSSDIMSHFLRIFFGFTHKKAHSMGFLVALSDKMSVFLPKNLLEVTKNLIQWEIGYCE